MSFQDAVYIFSTGLSHTVTAGLIFIMLIQPRRNAINLWFALFLATLATWAYFAMARIVPDLSPVSKKHTFDLAFLGLALAPVTLYLFVVALTRPGDLLSRVLTFWAWIAIPGTVLLVWTNRAVDFHFSGGENLGFDLRGPGYLILADVVIYGLAAALYVRFSNNPQARPLRLPAVLLLLGYSSNVIPPLRPLPVEIVLTAGAAVLTGYAVMRWQLFTPLGEANDQLRAANADLRGVINDLAAEKEHTEQLNDELREASRYKSEFLANMSHELRTPLNSIVGYSELLLKGIYGSLSEKQADRIEKIHRNGLNLLALINDVLDLSKIEGGRLELTLNMVRFAALADGLISTVEPLAGHKELSLEVDVEYPLRLIHADELRIRQAVLNLLHNAVKFTPGGYIRLSARNITVKNGQSAEFKLPVIGWLEDRHWLLISVEDSGIGIPPEEQATIFEEFRQAGEISTRQADGAGLGLAIARKLVELHTGRIWVRSQPGAGSTFYIALPALDLFDQPADRTEPSAGWGQKATVLMLEDNEESSQVLMAALRAESLRVVRVQDAASGLARAHEVQPAAILLDMLMPGLTAWDALRQFKHSPATADIPILLAGVLDQQPLGFVLGTSACVTRPLQRAELLTALAHVQPLIDQPVLIVDDDPAERDLLLSFFSGEGIPLALSDDLPAALEWLRDPDHLPGLVLLDLAMTQAGGFAVLQTLRSTPRLAAVPVVLLCAEHLPESEQAALHAHIAQAIRQQGWPADALVTGLQAALG